MEELLVFALLLSEEIAAEDEYSKRLDELFLDDPKNDDLLYLECETSIKNAIIYIRAHVDYDDFDTERFGRFLMSRLRVFYRKASDIRDFVKRAYSLWQSLPESIQREDPFFALSYADDPLSWGDEEQTRRIYEQILSHYKD